MFGLAADMPRLQMTIPLDERVGYFSLARRRSHAFGICHTAYGVSPARVVALDSVEVHYNVSESMHRDIDQ